MRIGVLAIGRPLKNIFEAGELVEKAVRSISETPALMAKPTGRAAFGPANSHLGNVTTKGVFHQELSPGITYGCSSETGFRGICSVDDSPGRRETFPNNTRHAEVFGHAHPGGLLS